MGRRRGAPVERGDGQSCIISLGKVRDWKAFVGCILHSFPGVAETNDHSLEGFTKEIYSLSVSVARN